MRNLFAIVISSGLAVIWLVCAAAGRLAAEDVVLSLVDTYYKVERESAEARRLRLEAIAAEREDNRREKLKLEYQLQQWNEILPPAPRARSLAPLQQKSLDRANKLANTNTTIIDFQANQNSIRSGKAINSLLLVLGPIAHRKSMDPPSPDSIQHFVSLRDSFRLTTEDAAHVVLVPFGSDDLRAEVRLNQQPLKIAWRAVMQSEYPSFVKDIEKRRVEFVTALQKGTEVAAAEILQSGDRMDEEVAKLMRELIARKRKAAEYRDGTGGRAAMTKWQDWNNAYDDLIRLRSTIRFYRETPEALAIKRFDGGNIEEFVCFIYHHGLQVSRARPADADAYLKIFQMLQQYFRDMQLVDDYRAQIVRDLDKLEIEDAQLLYEATHEKVYP